jgi:hypothetical protein
MRVYTINEYYMIIYKLYIIEIYIMNIDEVIRNIR